MEPEDQKLALPALCRNRPDFFGEIYLNKELNLKTPEFHRDIYKLFADSSLKRVALIAPVGHGKSTVVVYTCPVWATCYKYYEEILILSSTAEFAEHRLRKIKAEFEQNEQIQNDFNIFPDMKLWRDNEIQFTNGVRIMARGKGSQITGMRPDVILVDDIQTEEEARSELERARLMEWWYLTLLNRPKPTTGRIFIVGSISSKLAFLNRFCTAEASTAGWVTKQYAQKLSATIWPEMWSNEALEKKKIELSGLPGAFEALFQGDTSAFAKYAFKMEWVRYYQDLPKNLRIFTAVDPAAGGNDFTAIVTGGVDPATGLVYLIDIHKRNFDVQTLEMFSTMFMVYDSYRPIKFGIESVAFQKYLKPFFEKECRERGKVPNVVELKRDNKQSKDYRIRSLAPWFEEGKILIPSSRGGGMTHLLAEMEGYPETATVDVLDATSMLVNDLMAIGSGTGNRGAAPQPVYKQGRYGIGF